MRTAGRVKDDLRAPVCLAVAETDRSWGDEGLAETKLRTIPVQAHDLQTGAWRIAA